MLQFMGAKQCQPFGLDEGAKASHKVFGLLADLLDHPMVGHQMDVRDSVKINRVKKVFSPLPLYLFSSSTLMSRPPLISSTVDIWKKIFKVYI